MIRMIKIIPIAAVGAINRGAPPADANVAAHLMGFPYGESMVKIASKNVSRVACPIAARASPVSA